LSADAGVDEIIPMGPAEALDLSMTPQSFVSEHTAREPIRILRIIARLNVGGPALHVSHLSSGLDELGYETTLVAGTVGEGEGSMEYVARELGVEPVFIPELHREISPAADAAAVRRIRALIRELRPHVLHTHTAKAGAVGRAAVLLSGSSRPKVVVHTFHGHVLRGYFASPASAMFRQIERGLARVSDALIAVSPQVRDDLVRLGIAPASKIAVIRLGLDLERRVQADPGARAVARRALGVTDDRFLIGWLGRMTEIKRADDLVRAFAALREDGLDTDLVLVGGGPLRAQLEALTAELGVHDRCHFIGYLEDVAPMYAALDAVALTSANEGTPVSIIEALAAGKAVVATDVGGVSDVVEDERSGLLVEAGDVDAIAGALSRLATAPALRSELGERGRARVVTRYSVPRLIEDVDRLYRSLLAVPPPEERRIVGRISRPLHRALPDAGNVQRAPRRLRIVLLSQYFPPEVGATQSRMQAFAEYLAGRGHRVTVICEFPNHPRGVMPPEYHGRLVEDDRSNSYRILRVWVHASEQKTQATRIAFYVSYMGLATSVAPRAGRADIVLATSPPLFTAIAGSVIARMNVAPFVLDVRDLWPAAAVSLEQISPGLTRAVAERLERWLYRQAAQVVAVTRPFCDHVDRVRGAGPRTVLIPNGTLESFFVDGDGSSARRELGVGADRFLVTFAGTHGIAQALPSVLSAARRTNDGVEFALVGEGPLKEELIARAAEWRLDNVRFHPQVPMEEIPPLLSASDALLVPLSAHPTFSDFVPSKMIDFMAAGRPILLAAAGEAARILELAGAGIVVPPEDPQALAAAASWLAQHPDEAAAMGARGREFARKRLRSTQAERLEQVLFDVTRSTVPAGG
jgi:glycosyltransferase involved in cell wall biosynthesis